MIVEYDVETTGLQPYSGKNEAFLWIFKDDDSEVAIPFTPSRSPIPGYEIEEWTDEAWESARAEIQAWFDKAKLPGNFIRAWNTKFDRGFAVMAELFDLPGDGKWLDAMLTAHAVDERRSVALKAVSDNLLGEESSGPQKKLKEWLTAENKRRATLLTDAAKAEVGALKVKYGQGKCRSCKNITEAESKEAVDSWCIPCGEETVRAVNKIRLATAEECAAVIAEAAEITDEHGEYIRANYSHVPREIMHPYALEDVILTRRVSDVYDPRVADSDLQRVVDFEAAALDGLFWMEKRGLPVKDHGVEYRKLEQEVIANIEVLEARVQELAREGDPLVYGEELAGERWKPGGHWIEKSENGQIVSYEGGVARLDEFNPRSTPQILAALKARGADMRFMSKEEGKISADKENLEAVDDELAAAILEYRSEYRILTTYVRPMIGRSYVPSMNVYKEPFIAPDSRIHATYRQVGARTGRMSCADPNMQNQPRDDLRLRYNIVADPGFKLVTCDLSNIEMVLFAAYCGPGKLLTTIKEGGDLHTLTAEMVGLRDRQRAGGTYESARQQGKVFNFTIIYGGGLRSIRRYFRVDQNKAKLMKNRYMDAYPEVQKLQNRIQYRLEDDGYIQDKLISGRRFRVDPRDGYKGVNYLVQGTAASLLKYAVTQLHSDGVPMVALVHDEIVAHVPEDEAADVARLIEKRMVEFEPLQGVVPLRADADIVDRWSDAKPLKDADGKMYLFDPEWAKTPRRYIEEAA